MARDRIDEFYVRLTEQDILKTHEEILDSFESTYWLPETGWDFCVFDGKIIAAHPEHPVQVGELSGGNMIKWSTISDPTRRNLSILAQPHHESIT